jgi:hypothetical protein
MLTQCRINAEELGACGEGGVQLVQPQYGVVMHYHS